jgi:hypothetical protein
MPRRRAAPCKNRAHRGASPQGRPLQKPGSSGSLAAGQTPAKPDSSRCPAIGQTPAKPDSSGSPAAGQTPAKPGSSWSPAAGQTPAKPGSSGSPTAGQTPANTGFIGEPRRRADPCKTGFIAMPRRRADPCKHRVHQGSSPCCQHPTTRSMFRVPPWAHPIPCARTGGGCAGWIAVAPLNWIFVKPCSGVRRALCGTFGSGLCKSTTGQTPAKTGFIREPRRRADPRKNRVHRDGSPQGRPPQKPGSSRWLTAGQTPAKPGSSGAPP